jgi:uncharacterized protein YprB with RNaseH-like and TPR domain
MKPITKADIDRLRRKINRVSGGRMEPSPAAPHRSIDDESLPLTAPDASSTTTAFGAKANGLISLPATDNSPAQDAPFHYDADKLLDGEVIENAWGTYFLSEKFYPAHKRHGSIDISHLGELPGEWLSGLSKGEIPAHDPSRWAFLDTETTGLAGGTGTCAFLVGVGTIEDGGFRVRLFFMRDYDEEAAMLAGLAEFLRSYDVLVTYNGKAYDAPLLETRYRLARRPFPLERMFHLDLLHGARQLWKLRLQNCRLMELEAEILGVLREGDLAGELIPYYYFEYLRTRQAFRLVPLFHHNVIDIVSLACLTAVVLPAFASPTDTRLRHGAELLGLARWLRRSNQHEPALELYRRSIDVGLPDSELFPALWESALIEKRVGRHEAKAAILTDLTAVKNPFRQAAYEELAKHYERQEKQLGRALEMTEAALRLDVTEGLILRRDRLARRLDRQAAKESRRLFQQA